MIKSKTIKIPIYFGKLILIHTDNWEEIDKKFNLKVTKGNYSAIFYSPDDKDEYYIIMVDTTWSIISHEAVHAVNEIFLDRNIQLDRINDEPQAYLMGWIINEIDKFLNNKT